MTYESKKIGNADFRNDDLRNVNFKNAGLKFADFRNANLEGCNFTNADLEFADFRGANLAEVNFENADLTRANLEEINLRNTNFKGAILDNAKLNARSSYHAKGISKNSLWYARNSILPEGDIIGYKKLRNGIVAKLLIPKEAKRSNAFSRECRAEYVKVLEIIGADIGVSMQDYSIKFEVGKIVRPKHEFLDDFLSEQGQGIFFFITKAEALDYNS